jgi:REP element-mobilizing transposase RayT
MKATELAVLDVSDAERGPRRGGRRLGAGRKPKGERAGVSHRTRPALKGRFPVHVTVKLVHPLPRLRQRAEYAALRAAFAAGCRGVGKAGDFRLCHFAILNDHMHFIVEAEHRRALTRGAVGLLVRIARTLNRLWRRQGKVFADRFHDHVLKTPREVRNAIRYVLGNARKHAAEGGELAVPHAIDLFTSAPWFDGFVESFTVRSLPSRPTTDASTWLLTEGWRRHGLLSIHEAPSGYARASARVS